MKGFRKILVAMDGSSRPLKEGVRLAREEKSWITVVKVLPPYEGDLELIGIKNLDDVLNSGAEGLAAEVAGFAKSEGALIKTRIEEGPIPDKIVEVAAEERCDIIVMGQERRGFLDRLLGGSVVDKVIKIAPCPVLVVGS